MSPVRRHSGKMALEIKGYAHYPRDRAVMVFLYGHHGTKLPSWFKKHDWGVEVVSVMTNLFQDRYSEGLSEYQEKEFSIRISAPERAALEMLYHVSGKVTFDEASLIMENLAGIRPPLAQDLLMNYNSIKVKRLFMYLAYKLAYPWVEKLDPSKVDFGRGSRSILAHGMPDKKYKITVPRSNREDQV